MSQSFAISPVSWPANAGHPGDTEFGAAKWVDILFFEFTAVPNWVARTPAGHDISC
jgi:hypothetical protein